MPRKKKELTLDPELMTEYLKRRFVLDYESQMVREGASDLQVEFKSRGLDVAVVNKAITAAKAIKRAKAPEATMHEIVLTVLNSVSV